MFVPGRIVVNLCFFFYREKDPIHLTPEEKPHVQAIVVCTAAVFQGKYVKRNDIKSYHPSVHR